MERLNKVIDYLEDHLDGDIDLKEIERIALCSEYHFKRMFSLLSGMSVGEYVRRRRLSKAIYDLEAGRSVMDTALKYGYDSPDAFTRAFQSIHGRPPSIFKKSGPSYKMFPRMNFQLTIRGGENMDVRIVEDKKAFQIVGIKRRVPIMFNGVNPDIADMWKSLDMATIEKLKSLSTIEPKGLISASTNFSEGRMQEQGELDHYIGVATTEQTPDSFEKLSVPEMTWAVFEAVGPFPQTLQNIWGRIYSEWFPSVPYEQVEGPELLWNESSDTTLDPFRSEIWIPVRKQ